jgi:hypothetical protein
MLKNLTLYQKGYIKQKKNYGTANTTKKDMGARGSIA